ncbi:MAG: hypothetical protein JWP30_1968 [Homoserinimonas sp.]|nr:hypothetical protein [Homoserinimonas sp.]
MKRAFLVSAAVGTALLLSACGAEATPSADGTVLDPDAPVSISVAETAGIPSAFLSYGVQQGFFEAEGLDVSVDTSAGGAAAIPGLISGGLHLAGSNNVSALLAASKGLPVSIVAPGTFASATPGEDFSAVLVAPGSTIAEPADLAGKTIAVNTLENIGDISITASLEAQGIDASGISFVEIAFPEMLPALERGQIDAAWEIEPFVTLGLNGGNRPILWPYVEAHPGLMIGSFVATHDYIEQNPAVIDAFRRGVAATAKSVTDNPDAFRAALPELAKVDPAVAETMTLPIWKADVDINSLTYTAEQMEEQGVISTPLDIGAIVAD